MGLEYFEGFEDFSATFPIGSKPNISFYGSLGLLLYQDSGRFSDSKSLKVDSTASSDIRVAYFMKSSVAAAAVGVSILSANRVNPSTGNFQFNGIAFTSGTGSAAISDDLNVYVNAVGAIVVSLGANPTSTILYTTSSGLVTAGTWYHLGAEVTRSSSTGTVNVYLNGVQVVALTNVNTGTSAIASVLLCRYNIVVNWDDWYVCNSATWLGECRCSPLVPTADTAQKDFTPSTGSSNYACVDEMPPNTTDWVSSNTVSARDLYDIADLLYTPLAIAGVKTTLVAKKDDITTRTFRSVVKSDTTTAFGATAAAVGTFNFVSDVFANDPNTSAPWTKSGIDALQVGMEIVA